MDELVHHQKRRIDMLEERIRQLEEELAPSGVPVRREWGLTNSEARVFAHLTTRDVVTKPSILLAMYSDRIDIAPEIKIVDVFVCKMRKKLNRFGISIETVWGQGYALTNRQSFIPKRETA